MTLRTWLGPTVLMAALAGCDAQIEDGLQAQEDSELVQRTGGERRRGIWLVPEFPVVEYEDVEGELIVDGDMQLDPEELKDLPDGEDETGISQSALVADTARGTWPNGVVPYVFASNVTGAVRSKVLAAMALWEKGTSVNFVPRNGHSSYVTIRVGTSDYANVGRGNGRPFVTIRAAALTGVIVHELGHTLGLWHEHQRPDRNQHVRVHLDRVTSGGRQAYALQFGNVRLNAYDMGSIMHYCHHTFANSSRPTMTRLNGSPIPHNWIKPTARDYAGVNVMYDKLKPSVALATPAANAQVKDTITISATASDNGMVAKVQLLVDGDVIFTDTVKPFAAAWNTRTVANGAHTISARAYDTAGNFMTASRSVTVANGCQTASQLIGNGGFETLSGGPWAATDGIVDSSQLTKFPAHAGKARAWLGGYGTPRTDRLSQAISIPSNACSAKLTFFLRVISDEAGATADDTLKVQLREPTGEVVAELGRFSNLNRNTAYALKTFDLKQYRGMPLVLLFTGVENATLQTSFLVDDVQLEVMR